MREPAKPEASEDRSEQVMPLVFAIDRLSRLKATMPPEINKACLEVLDDFDAAYATDRRQHISCSRSLMLAMQRRLPSGPVRIAATALLVDRMLGGRVAPLNV